MTYQKESKELISFSYEEAYRPQIHFTPKNNWMNDPNGMVYYEGEYHLFYQYHPNGIQWGPMHWGHAVSKDMLHWEHLPIALKPDHLGMVFSGSTVVDWHDTSGFFNGGHGLVAIYTSATEKQQQQSIAYSIDRGRKWTTYDGNPVIPNPGIKDFRDPKVLWHELTKQWVMVLAAGQEVLMYASSNLIDWNYLSSFGLGEGSHSGVWECPDLFELSVENGEKSETRWILQVDIGDGAVAGGSGGQYFIGYFDGKKFVNDLKPREINWVDYGKDFYAAQSFSNVPQKDGRRLWLAWMSNWKYANEVPTTPWRSAMSLPREVTLSKGRDGKVHLIQKPIKELLELVTGTFVNTTFSTVSSENKVIVAQPKGAFLLFVEVILRKGDIGGLRLFETNTDEGCLISIDRQNNQVVVDRSKMKNGHFHMDFPTITAGPIEIKEDKVSFTIIVDDGSIEVFANEGKTTVTNLILPEQGYPYSISGIAEKGDITINLKGQTLKSVW